MALPFLIKIQEGVPKTEPIGSFTIFMNGSKMKIVNLDMQLLCNISRSAEKIRTVYKKRFANFFSSNRCKTNFLE